MSAEDRLNDLKAASEEWFAKERARLKAEGEFLKSVLAGRGGAVTLQDISTEKVGTEFVASVKSYIGKAEV